jgi:nitroreductase
MKAIRWIAAVALTIVIAVVIYPSVRGAYVRHQAARHFEQADALQATMTSPVAKQWLAGAGAQVKFALMRSGSTPDEIATLDASLVSLMATLKASPPPDNPVISVTTYDRVARPGQVFPIVVAIRAAVSEAFAVSASAELGLDSGWTSGKVRHEINQRIGEAPVETRFEFTVPLQATGQAWVRTVVVYRLSATGEGEDFQERPTAPLPAVAIHNK